MIAGPGTRAWVRGALRRPGRAVTVVIGIMVMTVATIAALVAGDSLDTLFTEDARAEWGSVDVEVTAADSVVLEESLARAVGVEAGERSPAWAPRVILPAVVGSGEDQEPDALVLGLGAEEQVFPDLEAVQGQGDFLLLEPSECAVNERLAERLGLELGDRLDLVAAVPEVRIHVTGSDTPLIQDPFAANMSLEVAGVVADEGVADIHRRPNVIVRRDVLQQAANQPD